MLMNRFRMHKSHRAIRTKNSIGYRQQPNTNNTNNCLINGKVGRCTFGLFPECQPQVGFSRKYERGRKISIQTFTANDDRPRSQFCRALLIVFGLNISLGEV